MERVADILIRYTKARIRALEYGKRCSQAHYDAARKIKNVAEYFKSKSNQVQIGAIRQIKDDLEYLLPSEESRFKPLRNKILNLIHQSNSYHESMEKPTPT